MSGKSRKFFLYTIFACRFLVAEDLAVFLVLIDLLLIKVVNKLLANVRKPEIKAAQII